MPTHTRRRRNTARPVDLTVWASTSPENTRAFEHLIAGEAAGTLNSFTADILYKLRRYGALSERQVAAVLRGIERDAEWAVRREEEAEALAGVEPLPEGRRSIVGEIVSAKWKVTPYGMQAKMLVREDSGNKVWGTIPASHVPDDDGLGPLVGQRIRFVAAVRRSDDDLHFGFYSRPQAALLVTAPEATEELPAAFEDADAEPFPARCENGHGYHPADGFCETCAEARMELQGDEFGEDL